MNKKENLKTIIRTLRTYGNRMMENLSSQDLLWIPEKTNARTINSYFRHIISAEIFWLKMYDDKSFDYFDKSTSIIEMTSIYNQLGQYLVDLVDNCSDSELIIQTPKFEKKEIVLKGTLAWLIERTSLHAIHHFAQIAYIRFARDNPPASEPLPSAPEKYVSWGDVMDTLIFSFLRNNLT